MRAPNLLFILSDQHNRDAMGCMGHPHVQTPHLDALAREGTNFTAAYTPCPICVPARAALATGQYVHKLRTWDNAHPYSGEQASWHHRLRHAGITVDSIGKLHFRSDRDDNGFSQEIEPLHIVDGQGDLLSCIRHDPPVRDQRSGILNAGPGESTYLAYDRRNTANALRWLKAHQADDRPWVLFLSYVCPHPPYIAPPADYERYPPADLELPPQALGHARPDHPALAYFRRFFTLEEELGERAMRNMMAAYYGACTFLDRQIGQVLQALEDLQLADSTRVIYTSDHGENRGARGLYGKFTLFDEACAVPFLMRGPDIPVQHVADTPISLLDCFPTILASTQVPPAAADADLPGQSLLDLLQAPPAQRSVFSEYHAVGSENAHYMLRNRQYKYMHFVGQRPLLFDLQQDPQECHDLAADPAMDHVVQGFATELRALLDPQQINAEAHKDQAARVAVAGGRAAVLARGAFTNSPVPGEEPAFRVLT